MKRFCLAAVVLLLSSSVLSARELGSNAGAPKKNSIGFGLGIPYGGLGINLDVNVAPNLNISAGLGTTVLAGMGYSFGAKYFLAGAARTFRPRVSVYYGVNAMHVWVETSDAESFTGVSLGFGAQWLWGPRRSQGLDLDIIYIASTSGFLDKTGIEPIKIMPSIGFRFAL